ncbi:replication factor C subunit 1-like [Diadema antillarum]|uniref:replication factor C subunit 1-like n=1 Tax=Diadema antillarum TaxID=105358 RepID=UPI003A83DB95
MDIRAFFGPKGKSKPGAGSGSSKHNGHGKRKHSSDDGDDFVSEKKRQATKMKKSNIIYDSDSDEDVKPSKPKSSASTTKSSKGKSKLPTPSPTKTKPITLEAFFGTSPVQRSTKKTAQPKTKESSDINSNAKRPRLDLEQHEDDDFEKTLKMLDDESTPSRQSKPGGGGGLASKLAAKAKAEKTRVPETPERGPSKEKKRQAEPAAVGDTPSGGRQLSKVNGNERKAKASPAKRESSRSTPTKSSSSKIETSRTPSKSRQESKTPPPREKKEIVSPPKQKAEKATPTAKSSASGDGEKKKGNPGYRSYLTREGPRSLGARDEPQGEEGCLEGLTFVITGVLEYFDKDEVKTFVEKYGGRVTGSVSKKTTHLVVGRDPGEAKVAKAQGFKIPQIQEDELYELIESRPGKGGSKVKKQTSQTKKAEKSKPEREPKKDSSKPVLKQEHSVPSTSRSKVESQPAQSPKPVPPAGQSGVATQMWVDKYKPASTKSIIGQQGDRSNAKKLLKWLTMWQDNNYGRNKEKAKFNRDDGFSFRAALLSGPPGVGKTTTAQLVCQETGFSYVEMNASDSRSKKTLQGAVSEFLDNQSLSVMWGAAASKEKSAKDQKQRHCLIMDEVDGVAGNEDRGGIQELIQMIKHTHIPVICICNDRSHPKIRSLVHYCFDLRFQRPRVQQIKGAMLSIAHKEGIQIPPASLDNMIMAANQDVRQVLHNLSMWSAGQKKMDADQMDTDSKNAKKDLKLGPWDVVRQVFSAKDQKTMSFIDKSDLFFHDYSIAPLFVQENYLSVVPEKAKGDIKKHLDLISIAADSLCQSDLVEKTIRSRMHWRLLPLQAVFASVIPGTALQGYMGHMINFPSWLGKNSTRGKNFRLLQELQMHTRMRTSASIRDLNQEYLPRLRRFLTDPLIEREAEGVEDTVQLMCDYDLLREDLDSLLEVTQYSGFREPMSRVPSKVKAALTRTYNKGSHMTPYAIEAGKKKKGRGGGGAGLAGTEAGLLEEEEEGGGRGGGTQGEEAGSENEEEEDVIGGMVKMKKGSSKAAAASSTTSKGKGSKGKGPMKGKAQPKSRGRSK